MSTTSLSAYAAWLAKHESKAPKRRSLDSNEETIDHTAKESVSTSTDPYLQWMTRKESKLPAFKIVVASPASIEAIVKRGRAAAAARSGSVNKTGLKERQANTVRPGKSATDKSADTHAANSENKKGTKRSAVETLDAIERPGKKGKTTTTCVPASTRRLFHSAVAVKKHIAANVKDQDKKMEETTAVVPSRCSTSSGPRSLLPKIDAVQYWHDVDRFSFLA